MLFNQSCSAAVIYYAYAMRHPRCSRCLSSANFPREEGEEEDFSEIFYFSPPPPVIHSVTTRSIPLETRKIDDPRVFKCLTNQLLLPPGKVQSSPFLLLQIVGLFAICCENRWKKDVFVYN